MRRGGVMRRCDMRRSRTTPTTQHRMKWVSANTPCRDRRAHPLRRRFASGHTKFLFEITALQLPNQNQHPTFLTADNTDMADKGRNTSNHPRHPRNPWLNSGPSAPRFTVFCATRSPALRAAPPRRRRLFPADAQTPPPDRRRTCRRFFDHRAFRRRAQAACHCGG